MRRLSGKLCLAGFLILAAPLHAEPEAPPQAVPTEPAAVEPVAAESVAAEPAGEPVAAEPLTVEASFAGKPVIAQSDSIELRLSRPLKKPEEARIAVVLGTTDLSGLFSAEETTLRLAPKVTPLPSGQQDLVVYLCGSDRKWSEIGRFPIRVLGRLGFERATIQPKLDLSLNGQVAESHFPDEPAPPRPTFQDFAVASALSTDHQRGAFDLKSQISVVGASNEQQALRFGQLGDEAPQVDLSSYQIAVQQGPVLASLGHVTLTGGNRHLMGSIASRGASLAVKLGQRVDLAFSATSGVTIVGFKNLLGLESQDRRLLAGTLGLELLRRTGGLRLETTLLDGKLLPEFGFNQGNVNDSEKNRAIGLRLLSSTTSQRVRLEAGFTRSEFTNPPDPFLAQDVELVPVQSETRNARYVDLNLDLFQGLRLGGTRTASLGVVLRHERVDPLFRSIVTQPGDTRAVTNAVLSDRLLNQLDVQGNVAGVAIQATHARLEDNLDEIPSILKTLTRRNFLSLNIPVAQLLGPIEKPSPFLPVLGYSVDRTHQFGESAPVNGEFDEASEVPDQFSTAQNASADWRFTKFNFRYALSHSFQDNRQPERQNSDFTNLTNGWTLGITPLTTLNLSLDLGLERAENKELADVNRTRRLGLSAFWNPISKLSLNLQVSTTRAENDAETNRSESFQLSASGSLSLPIYRSIRSQLSLGLNRGTNESSDSVFGFDSSTRSTALTTGISLSFF